MGYRTYEPWQGQGYATEATERLMVFGRAHGAEVFLLSISPDNAPSLAIAAKLGCVKVGVDERDGLAWVFRVG
jgi:RimJ/RimL family protein N-acetyltransferase